jgi:hypothetical protein
VSVSELEFGHEWQGNTWDRCEREKEVNEFGIVKVKEMGGVDRSVMEIAAPVDMEYYKVG